MLPNKTFLLLAVAVAAGTASMLQPSVRDQFFASLPLSAAVQAPDPGNFTESRAPGLKPRLPASPEYAAPENKFAAHSLSHDGRARTWYALGSRMNANLQASKLPAAIVLLHGSQRDGRAMLDMWQSVARSENIALIAPDSLNPRGWSFETDGPDYLEAVLADAASKYAFDPKRVYLFGHSSGAIHALLLANRTEGPWRAVAVHAGGLSEDAVAPRSGAPDLRLYLGDGDRLFPVDTIRIQAKALARAGHDTELVVIPGHTHWYYVIGPKLAVDAWTFLRSR